MIVGREETRHFILARSSLPQLGEHFSEVLRWQKTRPQILSAPTASTAPRQHIIDDQLAIEWSVFVRVMAKQLQVSLQTILEMDDFEEQGTWLQVVSELESAASNLMYGPMTEKCQDVLDEADLRQEAAAAARSTETNSDSH